MILGYQQSVLRYLQVLGSGDACKVSQFAWRFHKPDNPYPTRALQCLTCLSELSAHTAPSARYLITMTTSIFPISINFTDIWIQSFQQISDFQKSLVYLYHTHGSGLMVILGHIHC